jgi:hypothetical protein
MKGLAQAGSRLHEPLGDKEIRVLDLYHGKGDAPVVCCMRVVSIADATTLPRYDALSYTWGDYYEGREITVRKGNISHQVPVTDNLHAALRNIRLRVSKRSPMSLWVDAICIDQADSTEKSHQVAFMSRIYRSAACVQIWLGEPLSKSIPRHVWDHFKLYPFLAWTYMAYLVRFKFAMSRPNTLRHRHHAKMKLGLDMRASKLLALNDTLRSAENGWVTRAWVVQEYVLAQSTCLNFGRRSLREPAYQLSDVFEVLQYLDPVHDIGMFSHTLWLWSLAPRYTQKDPAYVPKLTAESIASDPRDKVYSILGLIRQEAGQSIVPNYEL